ncbi:hypothetical protein [Magnetospirillum moscoviense]|uniref:Glycosyltransferase n=1 Tax=Magnetospirillum moscoviense TaxID=1437059 RepID=A0A178MX71_9PROT|nr:hypothetical protein [Magnetospirillum moscoviense]OAN55385.1 hypothetical protein A6A05_08345 [Magnetospirillum moscoviense]
MLINIFLGNHTAYDFLRMQDILAPIAAGLVEAGHSVKYDLKKLAPAPAVNLLVEFFQPAFTEELTAFKAAHGDRLRLGILGTEDMEDASVMANPKQPWRRANFERILPLADFVWTLLPNTDWYQTRVPGGRAKFLAYGHCASLREPAPVAPKDKDCLLYGTSGPYRERIIEQLRARGRSVFVSECALPDYLRRDHVGRARLILDIRRNEGVRYCSPSRICYGLHSGTAVVAERFDESRLGELYRYCEAPAPADFVDHVDQLLKGDTDKLAADALTRFAAETSMRANLEAALAGISAG